MNYKRVLIITLDEKSVLYSDDARILGVTVDKYFKKKKFFQRVFSYIDRKFETTLSFYFWKNWKKKLLNYDLIILNSHFYSLPLIRYINKHYPEMRVIIWYSNPVAKDTDISLYKKLKCEVWTFDKRDAEIYNLNLNNQFVDVSKINRIKDSTKIEYDVSFVGTDKGRLNTILKLKDKFHELGLSTNFLIVNSSKNTSLSYQYVSRLSYSEVISVEKKSNVILDLVQENQTGYTLRPIEAIVLKKKLITNNTDITNADFYRKENIFILSKNTDYSKMSDFMKEPYVLLSDEIINKYTVRGWLTNFMRI